MRCSLLSCLALSRRELVWLSLAPLLVPIATQTGAFPSGIGSKPSRGTRPAPYRAGRVPRPATLAPKHIRELPWHLKRCPIMSLSLLETLLKLRGTRPRETARDTSRALRGTSRALVVIPAIGILAFSHWWASTAALAQAKWWSPSPPGHNRRKTLTTTPTIGNKQTPLSWFSLRLCSATGFRRHLRMSKGLLAILLGKFCFLWNSRQHNTSGHL